MSTLFISHSSKDSALAREVERDLALHRHHSVFLDLDPEKGIVAGRSWERTLYRKLRACRAVIALCTENYLSSHWCFAELALARMEGKRIFALQADPLSERTRMPSILAERQFIDLRRGHEQGFERLRRGLAELNLLGVTGEWPPDKPPYLGLSAYQEEHAPVFFGRETEVQSGVELLERGAPRLVMVIGASGSGKSSLVRAGILPQLRKRPDEWLILEPFRPGNRPAAELTESLARGFRRYAPENAAQAASRETILERLNAGMDAAAPGPGVSANEPVSEVSGPAAGTDERVSKLVELLERLCRDPSPEVPDRLRDYLAWSLEDLRRLVDEPAPAAASRGREPGTTTQLGELALELRRAAGRRRARVLVVIDQFEELQGRTGEQAQRFLALLRASIEADESPIMVLATMRSDFLSWFQRCAALRGVDFESLSLGPMRIEGMRRVIEEPARLGAIELEPGLSDRLLKDTETSDALPLLSFTLWLLWSNHREDGKLEVSEYERLGGLHGALVGEADAVLASARRQGREEDLRRAFLLMARLSEDGGYARAPVSWDQLEIERVGPILEQLVERRVLVSREEGETSVLEVAHEAIFRAWQPLASWLEDARSELLLRQQLARDARGWKESGRAPDHLWRGGRLLQARELLGDEAGRAAGAAETREKAAPVAEFVRAGLRRQRRQRLTVGISVAGVIVVLAGFLVYALQQARSAREERARVLDLARVAIAGEWLDKDPTTGALMLLEIDDPNNTRFAARRLSEALDRVLVRAEYRHAGLFPETGEPDLGLTLTSPGAVFAVDLAADGSRVLTVSGDRALVWDAESGRLLRTLMHDSTLMAGAFDPSAKYVVTRSGEVGRLYWEDRVGTTAWVWEVESGGRRFSVNHDGEIRHAEFSRGGRFLVTGSDDGTAQLWDVQTESFETLEHERAVSAVAFSPAGRRLATADGKRVRLWTAASAEEERTLKPDIQINALAFSRDGGLLAATGFGGTWLWETQTGKPVHEERLEHRLARLASFSRDGRFLVTASDEEARVWTIRTGRERFKNPLSHIGLVYAGFNADGSEVITVSGHWDRKAYGAALTDASVRYWDATNGDEKRVVRLRTDRKLRTVSIAPRAELLAANSAQLLEQGRGSTFRDDTTARLWNLSTRDRRLLKVFEPEDSESVASFSPDGLHVLLVSGARIRSLDLDTGRERWVASHEGDIIAASYGPGGRWVVTASKDGTARLWDAASGKERRLLQHGEVVRDAALLPRAPFVVTASGKTSKLWAMEGAEADVPLFELPGTNPQSELFSISADGKLAATGDGKLVRLWDVGVRAERFELPHEKYVREVAFAAGGALLVTRTDEFLVRVWDTATKAARFELEHEGPVEDLSVSPDGRLVLTASADKSARLWDLETDKRIRLPHECEVLESRFVASGRLAVTFSGDKYPARDSTCSLTVHVWDAESGHARARLPLGGEGVLTGFSDDGRLMFALQGSKATVWDVDAGEPRFERPFSSDKRFDAAVFSADEARLITESVEAVQIWAISGELLQGILEKETSVCLSPVLRRQNLGESETQAQASYRDCERRHGRQP